MRKFESGASKRKRKLEEEKSKQTGSILSYLKPVPATTTNDIDEEQSETPDLNSTVSERPPNTNDNVSDTPAQISVGTEYARDGDFQFQPKDPGMWPNILSHEQRTQIIQNGPTRPMNIVYPRDQKNRKFSDQYYIGKLPNNDKYDRQWLVYSESKNAVFCFCCKLFSNKWARLTQSGYSAWQNLTQDLQEHESSNDHKLACIKWKEMKARVCSGTTIDHEHQKQISMEAQYWKSILTRIISISKFLGKHNLPFQGHTDKLVGQSEGNFLGAFDMIAEFDPLAQEHLRKVQRKEVSDHYLGKNIQNEIISILADEARKLIINNCKKAKYFSVILDCTRDISKHEQLTVILRYFDMETNQISEHFLDFVKVDSSTGEFLTDTFLSELESHGLDISNCRGQAYDNGANMKGANSGVQKRILDQNPRAFFVPGSAHSLNLVVLDAAKSATVSIKFFGLVQAIYKFFAGSGKRWEVLLRHVETLTLKPLSETRWESRVDSLKCLKYEYTKIYDALVEISNNSTYDNDSRFEASNLGNQMKKYTFMVQLSIWYDILLQVNLVSQKLQSVNLNVVEAENSLKKLVDHFQSYRETGMADGILYAKELASDLDVEQIFDLDISLRPRRKKAMFSYETPDEPILSPEEKFKVEFFYVVVDQVLVSLKTRFDELRAHNSIFGFLYNISKANENLVDLLKNCKDLQISLTDGGNSDLIAAQLFDEIKTISSMLPDKSLPMDVISYITKNEYHDAFPNLLIALRILLTAPVTVASAERSFSRLKLIKTYLRSTMAQSRLSDLAVLSIESDTIQNINMNEIIDRFANEKARKVNFK